MTIQIENVAQLLMTTTVNKVISKTSVKMYHTNPPFVNIEGVKQEIIFFLSEGGDLETAKFSCTVREINDRSLLASAEDVKMVDYFELQKTVDNLQ